MVLNPWKVQNISEFVYFCCPECVFRSKEDSSFQAHALQNHVLSRTFFNNVEETEVPNIKEELEEGENFEEKTDLTSNENQHVCHI